MQEIRVGQYTIKILSNGNVFIQHNETSKLCGEGAEFPIEKFEEIVKEFYIKNF